jgi:flagellar L-ring protein precursor FlgH
MKHLNVLLLIGPMLLAGCGPSNRAEVVDRGLDEYVRLARSIEIDNDDSSGSLWTDRAGYSDAFRDVKAKNVADIVTIQVLEQTSAISEASTESQRDSEFTANLTKFAGLEEKVSELPELFDVASGSSFAGDASTSRRSVLSTTLTAKVVEVFPNRNLLLEGSREMLVNGERQIVTLRGIVRPEDISDGNVVLSSRIAEMQLEVSGKGIVSDAQKPGVLFKVLSGVWPF